MRRIPKTTQICSLARRSGMFTRSRFGVEWMGCRVAEEKRKKKKKGIGRGFRESLVVVGGRFCLVFAYYYSRVAVISLRFHFFPFASCPKLRRMPSPFSLLVLVWKVDRSVLALVLGRGCDVGEVACCPLCPRQPSFSSLEASLCCCFASLIALCSFTSLSLPLFSFLRLASDVVVVVRKERVRGTHVSRTTKAG
ncbi:hypothetical protein IWX90DRAFT_215059 [Phyllosticta citrichinensis]|uniref:Transmembrane protein n=1 Tax=Phyllosticta citrichinensis TaxID=1130410 RepID=A0ABR1XTG2_9PEZI